MPEPVPHALAVKSSEPSKAGPCGNLVQRVNDRAEEQRTHRRERPQPWILRKSVVILVFGIMGYIYYVYVVRFCTRMVRQKPDAMGGRTQGVAFLVIFNILFLFELWAYLKVIVTPPGYARDHTPKSAPPEPRYSNPNRTDNDSLYSDSLAVRGGPPYIPSSHASRSRRSSHSGDTPSTSPHSVNLESGMRPTVPKAQTEQTIPHRETPSPVETAESAAQAYARNYAEGLRSSTSQPSPSLPTNERQSTGNVVELDAIPAVAALHARAEPPLTNQEQWKQYRISISRQPPQNPVLAPEYRYCWRDEFIKPPRSHHCRICGTCVLMFDHHCPWIGQCIGARNRRFFFIFTLYNSIFALWTGVTLVIGSATHSNSVDVPQIVAIVLAMLFLLFTSALTSTHASLIMFNSTTVEHLGVQSMRRRESALLSTAYKLWQFKEKTAKRAQWDVEWGRIGLEGNLWWLGSPRTNWEAMMGPNPLYWFLPVGRSMSDGLQFPSNPRFDNEGRWRRRAEWPAELR